MIPQVVTNEAVTVISPNGIHFPQTDKTQPTHQKQDSLKKHLKAEAIQIMCGVVVLSLGIILAFVPYAQHFTSVFSVLLKSGYPFVGALFFIISGILSIITETKSTKALVDGSLAMNILSVSLAIMGVVILSVNLAALQPAAERCESSKEIAPTAQFPYHYGYGYRTYCSTTKAVLAGALSLMLICSVLELGLAVLSATLWWKQRHSDFPGNVIFLSRNSKNESNMETKALCNPTYEERMVS
ncbi:membrane-spanning 4-domains subfamily A member 6B-like isoform X2 [Psammomys obesus]|uniref:membrane-spanning 4-domains subfamily A member 6B-like isoform X2 n=1 Tax=Psammomys obesus TaxID=48139 RepID=UPI002452D705|nr:membrane-spanning 4-domains subfamily A member 6B-like isoform X2 [Psammomys obesus]